MRWLVIGLFVFGALWELAAWWGYRRDQTKRESADVQIGNLIPAGIGVVVWGIDILVLLIWLAVR